MPNVYLSKLASGLLTRNGRPSKRTWNVIIALYFLIIIAFLGCLTMQVASFHMRTHVEYVYVESDGSVLVTDSDMLNIKQPEKATELSHVLHAGDIICVQVSQISGEVLSIYESDQLVYCSDGPDISACICMSAFTIGFGIFFAVVINKKNPKRRFRKIQRKFLG